MCQKQTKSPAKSHSSVNGPKDCVYKVILSQGIKLERWRVEEDADVIGGSK